MTRKIKTINEAKKIIERDGYVIHADSDCPSVIAKCCHGHEYLAMTSGQPKINNPRYVDDSAWYSCPKCFGE